MVVTLSTFQPNVDEKWKQQFPFELSPFQKLAIVGILNGCHSLSCVPTGSGKTVPALFAISYFTGLGKKVIYTSPIKALSNQKYEEFRLKFPNITIGLLTGDIKINPNAQVLIMTAEILQNKFISGQSIEMDIEKEVGCIIHDEIHMINDKHRGHVWEQLLMKSPSNISLVLLSATLSSPDVFASWIESIGTKEVYLGESSFRNVPLRHFGFLTYNSTLSKYLRGQDKDLQFLEKYKTEFLPIYESNGKMDQIMLENVRKCRRIFDRNRYRVNTVFCIETVLSQLFEKDMLPAVCFLLSKKQIDSLSQDVTVNVLPFDSKVPYTIEKECRSILRKKFPNSDEFFLLPEFTSFLKLTEKGIGTHHSGMIPVLRELTEILFQRGIIRVLFATETFSVGLNMPIRTCLFTNIYKFDGDRKRLFHPHEFIQASGRAGRRGIDTVGNIIHLFNLYDDFELYELRGLLTGGSQDLVSKFKFSYHLFFQGKQVTLFYETSFDESQQKKKRYLQSQMIQSKKETLLQLETRQLQTSNEVMEDYRSLSSAKSSKKLKKNRNRQSILIEEYPSLLQDIAHVEKIANEKIRLQESETKLQEENEWHTKVVRSIQDMLLHFDFINDRYECLSNGIIASKIHLLPCIPLTNVMSNIKELSSSDIVGFLSCLIPISVPDNKRSMTFPSQTDFGFVLEQLMKEYDRMELFEQDFESGENYHVQYDMFPYVLQWIDLQTSEECVQLLHRVQTEKGVHTGDFMKFLIQMNNVVEEFQNIAEYMGDMTFLRELTNIPPMIMKYIISNQSLYV